MHGFQFLLWLTTAPREIDNNAQIQNFGGTTKSNTSLNTLTILKTSTANKLIYRGPHLVYKLGLKLKKLVDLSSFLRTAQLHKRAQKSPRRRRGRLSLHPWGVPRAHRDTQGWRLSLGRGEKWKKESPFACHFPRTGGIFNTSWPIIRFLLCEENEGISVREVRSRAVSCFIYGF